ncbi:MAG: NAD(P)-dependent oxidoreductase [Acidimicrobiales bacterium]
MKILVTGSAGMLGSALVPALVGQGHTVVATDIELSNPQPWGPTGPTLEHLDVRVPEDVNEGIDRHRPDFVAHLAAETSLEVCELDPDHGWATNAIGTKNVALAVRRAGLEMAYISTAGVFDGLKSGFYDEFDEPNPINVYGGSKHYGERIVQQLVPEHYTVRAGWMVGGGPGTDHKFISLIVQQLDAGAQTVHAVADLYGTPTYVRDFAECFGRLITSGSYGLYHMTGTGGGTRFDVAREILRVLGRDDVELVPVGSDFFAKDYFAPRPPSEQMRNRVLDLQGMNTMRPWEEALEDYLHSEFADRIRATGVLAAR